MPQRQALQYLSALEAKSRGEAVMDALASMIEQAGLQVGDRLPPEVSLAEALSVGRSTIREVLNRWEGLGIIRRRRGDGTYLMARVHASSGLAPVTVRLAGEALLRIQDVRRTLEVEVARRAAALATPEQKARISRLCDELLVLVNSGAPWRKADAAFHGAIHDAMGNPMFGHFLRHLEDALERSEESPFSRNDFALESFPPHRALADAIVAGDPEAAAAATHLILDAVSASIKAIIDG